MKTKLTVRIDDALIAHAKAYAAATDRTLSQVITNYFEILRIKQSPADELPPTTKSLVGVLKRTRVDEENYKKYLDRKHQ